jgi:hypothetical protein
MGATQPSTGAGPAAHASTTSGRHLQLTAAAVADKPASSVDAADIKAAAAPVNVKRAPKAQPLSASVEDAFASILTEFQALQELKIVDDELAQETQHHSDAGTGPDAVHMHSGEQPALHCPVEHEYGKLLVQSITRTGKPVCAGHCAGHISECTCMCRMECCAQAAGLGMGQVNIC